MIQNRRKDVWNQYKVGLKHLEEIGVISLPNLSEYSTNNAHMFYLVCRSLNERTELIKFLKDNGVFAVFHYLSLHLSDYYKVNYSLIPDLPNCDRFADCLLRLPLFYEISNEDVNIVVQLICEFYKDKYYI